ncbi:carboxylesterase 1D-like isoform X2 [Paramacrobiotus metropolitanus]|uniref:carboxylesterase 1D-like isoform X2 n=1 Tax=Paramacrobiotus metropolitanus TaxID=2943436 RepID=UPI002445A184|nr:carboxylesterase 1D-like isoform X2 [Paramacrobiotus metropolitanus]
MALATRNVLPAFAVLVLLNKFTLIASEPGTIQLTPAITLKGEACCSTGDSNGYVYYGIRYATARRFEHSMANENYSYLRNTTRPKRGPVCPQTSPEADGNVVSEDCLYLDVYVPPINPRERPKFPVLMFIYGGGLQEGSKDTYSPSSLVAYINAIVVFIDYRVGAFGFLSTGDATASGNYGLGDCKVAVKWIQKHIGKFGGDPAALTVFGESAGAALTSALIVGRDQSIRNSLRAVALLSGSITTDILYDREPKETAMGVAQKAGCPTESSAVMIGCLKQLPVEDLLRYSPQISDRPTMPFGFAVDGEHIPDIPIRALKAAAALSAPAPHILTGYLREDSSYLLQSVEPDLVDPSKPLTVDQLRDVVGKRYLPLKDGGLANCSSLDTTVVTRILQQYNITDSNNRDDTLWKFFHLATDAQFGHQAVQEALLYASSAGTSQVYRVDYNPGMGMEK